MIKEELDARCDDAAKEWHAEKGLQCGGEHLAILGDWGTKRGKEGRKEEEGRRKRGGEREREREREREKGVSIALNTATESAAAAAFPCVTDASIQQRQFGHL